LTTIPVSPRPLVSASLEACEVINLPTVPYSEALALQRQLNEARCQGRIPDTLLLLEHPPVFTLGSRGSHADILATPERLSQLGIEVHQTNRGGLVTYHGPGQLVGYPIADLRRIAGDAPRYVSGLEETLIRALAEHGIVGFRDTAARGVWTTGGKIAAIGVAVSRGITMHGFAVNLQPDLAHFALIDPCGLRGRGITSAERLLGRPIDLEDFRTAVAFHFGRVFEREMRTRPRTIENVHGPWPLSVV
jgi:lipoate-protein ligase B